MSEPVRKVKIGFVGLGRMGGGIARNLAKADIPLLVYDTRREAREPFATMRVVARDIEEAMAFCDVLMLSLPATPDVEQVVERFLEMKPRGKIVVDLSTSIPSSTRRLARKLKDADARMLDAPLAGGPANAARGDLTVMVGGSKGVYESLLPIFDAFAEHIFHVGSSGAGHTMKLAGNYLSILYVALYAEILPVLQKMGIDGEKFFDLVSTSGGNSPMFQRMAPKILQRNYTLDFRLDFAIKDLSYARRLFDEVGAPSSLLDAGMNLFRTAARLDMEEEDISSVARVMQGLLAIAELGAEGLSGGPGS